MLAIVTGSGWNVDKIAAEMPLSLLYEWQAFATMNPLLFSPEYVQSRHDWNAGMIAARFIYTMTALFAKRPSKYDAGDLMFKARPRQQVKTDKELYLQLKTALFLSAPSKKQ